VLIGFVILFGLMHIYFLLAYVWVTRDTRKLKRDERKFMKTFYNSGRCITPEEEADYCYHYYKKNQKCPSKYFK
jgi:hypothetical protein